MLSPDGLPWQADGQRCQPELADRQAFYEGLEHWLLQHNQPVVRVGGSWDEWFGHG